MAVPPNIDGWVYGSVRMAYGRAAVYGHLGYTDSGSGGGAVHSCRLERLSARQEVPRQMLHQGWFRMYAYAYAPLLHTNDPCHQMSQPPFK